MKASELMIGDWVNLSKGNWSENRKVELIDIEMIAESVYLAEPIHLTPEILEKNGFEMPFDNVYCLYIKGRVLPFKINYLMGSEGLWAIDTIIKVHYVHELQHALRLCGIEKEIVL